MDVQFDTVAGNFQSFLKSLQRIFWPVSATASMRDDFEITVPQIDTLVEIVKAVIGDKGGVRMTGGGFGGCIVALIPEELVPAVQQAVAEQYEAKTGIKETFYVCKPSQGAGQC